MVKTDDKHAARRFGIHTFPALVYVRRSEPIFYDGDFDDADEILRWIRAHDSVVHWSTTDSDSCLIFRHLDDDDFEDRTDSIDPDKGALDWFVML